MLSTIKDWIAGKEYPIPAYVSTSVMESVAKRFYGYVEKTGKTPLMLEIFVPSGVRGVYIGDNTAYVKKESEFLLGRGLKYRVIARTDNLLRLEVLP